jgi:quinone-modifying oxidoreductase subunit QmoC
VQHYALPRFLGSWANQVKYLPVMLVIPAALLLLALVGREPLWGLARGILQYLHHEGFYASLFPHWLLIGFYTFFWGLAMLGALAGVVRFWRAMKAADSASGGYTPVLGVVPSIIRVLRPIFTHEKFGKCNSHAARRLAHLSAFYGFATLFIVSIWAVVALYIINPLIENDLHYPFGLLNPWKMLANLGGIVLIVGCVIAIRDRLAGKEESAESTPFDWIFAWLLLGVAVTGLLTEVLRLVAEPRELTALVSAAYAVYFVHLVLVFDLLVYLPYSKFAHIVYRTVALVYGEHTGRNQEAAEKE